jgi:hypothetical protein
MDKSADITVLDGGPFAAPESIKDIPVGMTILKAGRCTATEPGGPST